MEVFEYVLRERGTRPKAPLGLTSLEQAEKTARFHAGLPGYAPTPLAALDALAGKLGVAKVWVKDESKRFGLNAFKALGGSYAMGEYLAQKLGEPLEKLTFDRLCSPLARRALGEVTFVTATDGNHGRGVAWSARLLGQKAVVYMPKGSARERLENIRAQGAQAEITSCNYDGAVRLADKMGRENGWVLVQDTAWPGYEEIPARIMQGYTTLAREIAGQLKEMGEEKPTHLLLQAGVGSFAGAALVYFTALWGEERPETAIVPVPQRQGGRRETALCHRGHGQHDGRAVLRGALHHQLGDPGLLRRCLPLLRGRLRRPGNAPAGPAGGRGPRCGLGRVGSGDRRRAGGHPDRGAAGGPAQGAGPGRALPCAAGQHRG